MMPKPNKPVTFVWFGDLHLTDSGLPNHVAAQGLIAEVNTLVRPDFAVFAGDNVQHAKPEQFELFNELRSQLTVPHHVLVGDHDVHHDPTSEGFRKYIGETYGSFTFDKFRFIRLNTLEYKPVGLSATQIDWLRAEVDSAVAEGQSIVLLQHHYPYKVWEQYQGPGLDEWRAIVQSRRIAGIFCGHTHYGQIANDGRNVCIASRSIGDPEGGEPGYTLVHLRDDDDFTITYREVGMGDPVVLITHPRELLLATESAHIVSASDRIEIRIWSASDIFEVKAKVDQGEWSTASLDSDGYWKAPLITEGLTKGEHIVAANAISANGMCGRDQKQFMFDPTGRYTAIPRVEPVVKGTAFC